MAMIITLRVTTSIPWLLSELDVKYLAARIVRAIRRRERLVMTPKFLYILYLLRWFALCTLLHCVALLHTLPLPLHLPLPLPLPLPSYYFYFFIYSIYFIYSISLFTLFTLFSVFLYLLYLLYFQYFFILFIYF